MLTLTRIFEHALRQPQKTAAVHEGTSLSYAEFARRIATTRHYLDAQRLPAIGVAVILVTQLLDDWILMFALRSLGLSTVAARDTADIHTLDLPDIACVISITDEGSETHHCTRMPISPGAGCRCRATRWWLQDRCQRPRSC